MVGKPRVKSERELKWEQEHAAEIKDSVLKMKEIMKVELADKKKLLKKNDILPLPKGRGILTNYGNNKKT